MYFIYFLNLYLNILLSNFVTRKKNSFAKESTIQLDIEN